MIQRNHSFIESLEGRQMLSGAPWGAQARLIGQDAAAAQFPQITGKGQAIAIIDSGVDYNHPTLGGGWGKKVVGGWDFSGNDSNPMSDSYAHGTGVAGLAAASNYTYKGQQFQGIAPGANIIALRQNNQGGVANALKWVIANKAKYNIVAVNMTDYGGGGNKSTGTSIKASLATLNAMNVYVASPSGNGGAKHGAGGFGNGSVTVGSVNKGGGISGFTQRGAGLNFLAPGEKVTLPYYDTGSKKHIFVDVGDGTSWSAPQIAGAAALIRQIKPGFSNAQITDILSDSAVHTYDSATKRSYPRLNLHGALKLAFQRAGQAPPANPDPTPDPTPTPPPPANNPGAPGGVVVVNPTTIGTNTVLQAEDFDAGNNGAAYKDADNKNTGGNNYRATGVDIVSANDAGSTRAVGVAKAGEWLKYTVNVPQAGTYTLDFRVAALGAGGQFHLEVDGKNVTGTLNAPNTRNWNAYAGVQKAGVNLTAGKHTLRLVFTKNGASGYVGNFNSIRFTKGGVATPSATPAPAASTPFKTVSLTAGKAVTIQAEDFDNGASGVAYKDSTAANQGGQYRKTAVDLQKTNDAGGGNHVGFMTKGEWLNYTVNVTKAGTFNLDARIASQFGGTFHVEVDGRNVTGTLNFTKTGSFIKWATISKKGIQIAAGKHTVKLVVDSVAGNKPFAGNVNWIKFS
jgi:hypothetical protein